MIKSIFFALVITAPSVSHADVLPDGCREGLIEVPRADESLKDMGFSTAVFVMEQYPRRVPGTFFATINGEKSARVLLGGPKFVCEYDVTNSCPQLHELASAFKEFRPDVGANFDRELKTVTLHAIQYRIEFRSTRGSRGSLYSTGSESPEIKAFVESARGLLEACIPDHMAAFARKNILGE